MSRYIDAEWLKELYKPYASFNGKEYSVPIGAILANIDDAPSIDIVRCGECKYYIDNSCDCYSLYGDLSGDLIGVSFEPNEDFFCSYGSRSEKLNNSKERSE